MTTNGDGNHYCGREGTPGFRELIAACDLRQRVAARRVRIDQLMAAAEAVPLEPDLVAADAAAVDDLDDAPANAPATETGNAPAKDEQPEAAGDAS